MDNERYDDYNRWTGGINFGGKARTRHFSRCMLIVCLISYASSFWLCALTCYTSSYLSGSTGLWACRKGLLPSAQRVAFVCSSAGHGACEDAGQMQAGS